MKLFSCNHCQNLLFFESVSCVRCGRPVAYLPDRGFMSAVEPLAGAADGRLLATAPSAQGAHYRACRNELEHGVCNWAVPAEDPEPYCRACRLNTVIPNLSAPGAKEAWQRLEAAKRRLLYTLLDLGLPVESKAENPAGGLAFAFLADDPAHGQKVYTGHSEGLVTINIAEADDPARERARVEMGEPYRTVLGHFRHEIGHHYWERLVKGSARFEGPFRALFGDERADYAAAQRRHYGDGPPADWPRRFVSAYASMHPWEDWAETWAHYLHMTDTLETARAHGLALKPSPATGSARLQTLRVGRLDLHSFEDLTTGWVPLTLALNDLNRSMGLPDVYPFVLPEPAMAKLRFVHDVIEAHVAAVAAEEELEEDL